MSLPQCKGRDVAECVTLARTGTQCTGSLQTAVGFDTGLLLLHLQLFCLVGKSGSEIWSRVGRHCSAPGLGKELVAIPSVASPLSKHSQDVKLES